MNSYDAKRVLADNVKLLMNYAQKKGWEWDVPKRLGPKAGVGHMTIYRMIGGKGAEIATIERVAAVFRLKAWQLLVPIDDPRSPPVVVSTRRERNVLAALKDDADLDDQAETIDRSSNPNRPTADSPSGSGRPGRPGRGGTDANSQGVRPETRPKVKA